MTGSACQNGASAKADAFILSKTFTNKSINIRLIHSPSSSYSSRHRLYTFLIAITRACFIASRTRTRKKNARARAWYCFIYARAFN